MKRLISLAIAVIVVLAMALPAMAATDVTIGTSATVGGGSGSPPTICAKWETPDDLTADGTQVSPTPETPRPMKFYVVAGDPNGINDIYGIDVAVYYTDGPKTGTEKFNAQAQRTTNGWVPTNSATAVRILKYSAADKVDMNANGVIDTGDLELVPAVTTLFNQKRLTLGPGMVLGDANTGLIHNIMNDKQIIVEITAPMDPCQPSQNYEARIRATDMGGQSNAQTLNNLYEYLCVVALKTDFTSISWGNINVGVENLLTGDNSMSTPELPTVQNVGNNRAMIQVNSTPLTGAVNGKKIKNFDAKMNQLATADTYGALTVQHGYIQYNADANAVIMEGTAPVVLPPCSTAQIDFSVFPALPTIADTYSGSMKITILKLGAFTNPTYSVLPTT